MKIRIRLLCLIPLFGVLSGCPGFSDPGPANVQGTWTGTITMSDGTQSPVVAGIFEKGLGFVYVVGAKPDSQIQFLALDPIASKRDISTTAVAIDLAVTPNCPESECLFPHSLVGTAYADRMTLAVIDPCLSASVQGCQPHVGFGVELTRDQPYTGNMPVVDDLSPFPQQAGQWQGYYLTTDLAVSLAVKAGGAFTGTDAYGCALSGGIEQNGSWLISSVIRPHSDNLFMVTLDGAYEPFRGKCGGKLNGVGYLSSTGIGPFKGVPGTYFYMGIYGEQALPLPDFAYMVELKVE